jgi:hypothetical protein
MGSQFALLEHRTRGVCHGNEQDDDRTRSARRPSQARPKPPRQWLVLDRAEHAGNIRLVGKSITRAASVTPTVCPIYWW